MTTESLLCVLGVFSGLWPMVSTGAELVTDRPDATESSSVVEPGYGQVEMGWLLTDSGDTTSHEFAQTLLRIGVVDHVELRVGWSGYLEADRSDAPEGVGDGELGLKIYFAEERGFLPETALLASVSVPWGDSEVSSKEVDPAFRFAFAHTLSDTASLSYNLGAEWGTEDDATLSSFVYTTALGIGLTDSLGLYVVLWRRWVEHVPHGSLV